MITPYTDKQLDAQIETGEAAKLLLTNPVLLKALEDIHTAAASACIEAQDKEEREAQWYMTRAIKKLKEKLNFVANAGTTAKETKAKRVKHEQKS